VLQISYFTIEIKRFTFLLTVMCTR